MFLPRHVSSSGESSFLVCGVDLFQVWKIKTGLLSEIWMKGLAMGEQYYDYDIFLSWGISLPDWFVSIRCFLGRQPLSFSVYVEWKLFKHFFITLYLGQIRIFYVKWMEREMTQVFLLTVLKKMEWVMYKEVFRYEDRSQDQVLITCFYWFIHSNWVNKLIIVF